MPDSDSWTIGQLLKWTTDYFRQQGAESPRLDAEVLLAEALGCQRIELYTAFQDEPLSEVRERYRALVRRRAQGTPVAYLVGHREFYSLPFRVTPDVLIPRPETEHVMLELLDRARARNRSGGEPGRPELPAETGPPPDSFTESLGGGHATPVDATPPESNSEQLRILDVGTGSGVLAICAARHLPAARITAVDVSPAALAVARINVDELGVADRVVLLQSDLLQAFAPEDRFDFIISNPPYVSEREFAQLSREVTEHEPRQALVAGPAGTEVISRLIPQAARHLVAGGWLIFEISPMIAHSVRQMLEADESFDEVGIRKDLAGHERVVRARRTVLQNGNAPKTQHELV